MGRAEDQGIIAVRGGSQCHSADEKAESKNSERPVPLSGPGSWTDVGVRCAQRAAAREPASAEPPDLADLSRRWKTNGGGGAQRRRRAELHWNALHQLHAGARTNCCPGSARASRGTARRDGLALPRLPYGQPDCEPAACSSG